MKKYREARFYEWDELDRLLLNWAKDYFGTGVYASTTGEEDVPDDWYVLLSGLKPEHRAAFDALFEPFNDVDTDLEWPGNAEDNSMLPQYVSNYVLSKIIGGGDIAESITGYDGVYLMIGEVDLA